MKGQTISCGMEADAGAFTVEQKSVGTVRLKVGWGMSFETDTDNVELQGSEDKVFVLTRVPAENCMKIES